MTTTRRSFISSILGLAVISPWRPGWSSPPSKSAHDTAPAAVTVSPVNEPVDWASQQSSRPALSDAPWLDSWNRLPRHPVLQDDLQWFEEWTHNERNHELTRPHGPVLLSTFDRRLEEIRTAFRIHQAITSGRPTTFIYQGGSQPGTRRKVIPVMLFTTPPKAQHHDSSPEMEPLYLLAHCLIRHATRTFRINRILLP